MSRLKTIVLSVFAALASWMIAEIMSQTFMRSEASNVSEESRLIAELTTSHYMFNDLQLLGMALGFTLFGFILSALIMIGISGIWVSGSNGR